MQISEKEPSAALSPCSLLGGEDEPDILLEFVDFSRMVTGSERVYLDEIPWGIKKDLAMPKDKAPGSVNQYTRQDEGLIASNLFWYCSFVQKFPLTLTATTCLQKKEVMLDKRISSHFVNNMKSFRLNMTPGKQGEVPMLDTQNALTHCFFFSSHQCLRMVRMFVSHVNCLDTGPQNLLKKDLESNWKKVFDMNPFGKAGLWTTRLGPSMQLFVEGNRLMRVKKQQSKKEAESESELAAENKSGIYTYYFTSTVFDLCKLLRNCFVHFEEIKDHAVRDEMCPKGYDDNTLLRYFTLRYPALIVTIFEVCTKYGIAVKKADNIKTLTSFGADAVFNSNEVVTDEQVKEETNRLAKRSRHW